MDKKYQLAKELQALRARKGEARAIDALNKEINIPQLTYTTRKAEQISGSAFAACVHESKQVDEYFTETGVKYDLKD